MHWDRGHVGNPDGIVQERKERRGTEAGPRRGIELTISFAVETQHPRANHCLYYPESQTGQLPAANMIGKMLHDINQGAVPIPEIKSTCIINKDFIHTRCPNFSQGIEIPYQGTRHRFFGRCPSRSSASSEFACQAVERSFCADSALRELSRLVALGRSGVVTV